MFSDKVVCVDDYKEHYRSQRLRTFDFIDFLTIEPARYAELSNDAAEFAQSMAFSFEGAKPAGDVVAFFDALRLHPQLRWDVFVSSEYLTMSVLVKDTRDVRYETAIDSVFRNETANAGAVAAGGITPPAISVEGYPEIRDIKDLVQAFSSGNPNHRGHGSRTLLNRMIFGYGWAAERSHFYNAVAASHNADAFLAPLRDAFCESCCRLESRTQTESLLEGLKTSSQAALAKILEPSGRAKFAVKLPFFTSYLISKCTNPKQCIDLALEMRNSNDFQQCRIIFHNLTHLSNQDRYTEVNSILNLLDRSAQSLLKKYGVSTGNGIPISLSLGISGFGAGTSIKLDALFARYRNRSFSRIFRNIAQDMLSVERLGGLRDKLTSQIREHKDANYPRIAATPKFMEHRESDSGRPARLPKRL